jgi:hypothetical protein
MAHVAFLAAPEREGRGFGSKGLAAAAGYIRAEFAAAGLTPGGDAGAYFQAFRARGGPDDAESELHNVIGVLHGSRAEFAGEAALLTAHYDHLGFGWPGARAGAAGQWHPGADDNASGVAVLIEVARSFARRPAPPRTIVFVAFGGEEAGLLGARHYVRQPRPVPLGGIYGVVNLDTVGRLGDQPLSVLAAGSAREWPSIFNRIGHATGIVIRTVPDASESSDQRAFIEAGVPGVQLFSGATLDYHRPTDTADKVDGRGLVRVATVASEALGFLASTGARLTFQPLQASATSPAAAATRRRAALGAIPDFSWRGPGVRLDGIVPGSPADKAGLKPGDVLTRFAEIPVEGLAGFNELLKEHQPGDRVSLRWTSAGRDVSATVELSAR